MNNCNFAGNVGNVRTNTVSTRDGDQTVLNFSLAVQKRQKDQNGNYMTLWVDCALWGKRAESLSHYINKGTKLAVCGSVDVEIYQDGNGNSVPKLKLNVSELTLQSSKQESGAQSAPTHQTHVAPVDDDFDQDVPF